MTVFAIDPGPHTGIFWQAGENEFRRLTLDFTQASEVPSHLQLFQWLDYNVGEHDTVVCESFEFRKEYRDREYLDYDAAEYVGVVKLWCQLNNVYYYMQSASEGKGFWDDDKLRRVKLYAPGKDNRHVRDATRHWLYYMTFKQNQEDWLYELR